MKPWWKSRTIWFNAAAGGVAYLAGTTDSVTPHLPVWAGTAYGTIVAAVNVMLRFATAGAVVAKRINKEEEGQ